jgi:hypothetical protein
MGKGQDSGCNDRRGKENARKEEESRPLDFRHDGYRRMRALRELAASPAKLVPAVADNPSARSPVPSIAFQHARPSALHFQRRG